MRTFAYRGYTRAGGRAKGFIDAVDPKDARERLIARDILPDKIVPAISAKAGRLPLRARGALFRELGALARTGVPLEQALTLLAESHPHGPEAGCLAEARDRLRQGALPDLALAESFRGISAFEGALLQAGRRSGRFGEVLEQMAEYLEDESRLREGIRSAMLYPALVLSLGFLIGVVMILAVFPRFSNLFAESGAQLPALTRAMLWIGREGRPFFFITLAGLALFTAYAFYRSTTPSGRMRLESILVRTPWIRNIVLLAAAGRFSRTLALAMRGGIALPEAISLAARASGLGLVASAGEPCAESVRLGRAPAEAIGAIGWIGARILPWYRAGESSGDPAGLLEQAARRFEADCQERIHRTFRLLEPALIIAVGGIVLAIAWAILLPLLSLNRAAF